MFAHVHFEMPDGALVIASHGDLVGRLATAAVHLDDARVSEAHAMVSLRGRELKLLALRGRFAVDGKTLNEITLIEGQQIEIASGVSIVVAEVNLPTEVLAIEGDEIPQQVIGGVCSLMVGGPRARLLSRYDPLAAAHIWSIGTGWRIQVGDAGVQALLPGDSWIAAGMAFRAVAIPLEHASQQETRLRGSIGAPIRLIANYDSVHIHRDNQVVIVLGGISARILSELVAIAGPADWDVIAGEVWRDTTNRSTLRKKWDVNLSRLRSKLRAARIRADLIRADGSGKLELVLNEDDTVEDRT